MNLLSIRHPRKKKMSQRGSAAAMVIPFAIRGIAFANGQGIGACLPIPVNSHSHSHSLKILGFGGGCQSRQKKKQTPTHTVTEIRGHCSEGGRGWGLSSSLFSEKKTFILERLEHLQKSWFFDANYLSDSLAIPKTNCVHSQSSFEFPIPLPFPSKF